jgi:hypothetical protein
MLASGTASGRPGAEECDPMDNREVPSRSSRPAAGRQHTYPTGEEQQRVLGFPVDSFGQVDRDWLDGFAHPLRRYRRWVQRRRLGIYAPEDDEPQARR